MHKHQPLLSFDKPGRGRVYDSILETIGNTPLVRIGRLAQETGCQAEVLAKLEFFNPIASVKDRIAVAMLEAMEADGIIGPGSVIVEPTSGNTGIGLAFACAAKGYRCILTMPDSFSIERRKLMKFLGAELALTPREKGIGGAIEKAKEIIAKTPKAVMPWQFGHPANPEIHRRTTAEEIWRDTSGVVDVVVLGVGTGGTLTGVGDVLKSRNGDIRIIAVEPENSPVLSGGTHTPHMIQGIGAGFIPEVLDTDLIDEVLLVSNDEAILSMVYFDVPPNQSLMDEALEMARRAIELDDQDANNYFTLGRVHLARREYDLAIEALQYALELNPCLAVSYCGLGDSLAYEGRLDEAIVQFELAIKLSPHDPFRWAFFSYRSLAHLFRGEFDQAVFWARNAVRIPNAQYWARAHLVAALGHLGDRAQAALAVADLLQKKPDFSVSFAREHLFYLKRADQLEIYLTGLTKAGLK